MQKPTIFVTRRWPKETVEEMKKFFEVTINHDDRPLTQNEIADGFESHDALAPTVSDNIDQNIIKKVLLSNQWAYERVHNEFLEKRRPYLEDRLAMIERIKKLDAEMLQVR